MSDAAPDAAWTRPAVWAGVGLVAAALVSLVWLVHPWYDPTNDGSLYVLTAESLLEGEGYSFLGRPFRIRPPGFSALIAPLLAVYGRDFGVLNLAVSLTGVAAVGLMYAWLRPRLGWPLALAVAASVWLSSAFERMGNQVMSDVPYAAVLFGCLLLERWARQRPSARRDALLGLAIGLGTFVRTVNVFLVPAILGARVLERLLSKDPARPPWGTFARRRLLVVLVVPFLVGLPWSLRQRAVYSPEPVDQNALHSYGAGMWNRDAGDPASEPKTFDDLLERIPLRVGQTVAVLGKRLQSVHSDENRGNDPLSTTLAVLFLAGLGFDLVRRRGAAELYVLGNLLVLSIYFGFDDRLVLPIWLIAYPAAIGALRLGAERLGGARTGLGAGLAAAGLMVAADFAPRHEWPRIEQAHGVYSEVGRLVDDALPPQARVGTSVGWHYSIYLGRPVWSFFFAVKRDGGFQGAERMIDRYGLTHVVLSPAIVPSDRSYLAYFDERYGLERQVGLSRIYRVR